MCGIVFLTSGPESCPHNPFFQNIGVDTILLLDLPSFFYVGRTKQIKIGGSRSEPWIAAFVGR
jgi:hypothetical protein